MRLIVPYLDELAPADTRLVQLANFLGLECELLRLAAGVQDPTDYVSASVQDKNASFTISPSVIGKWLSTEVFPSMLASYLISHFPFVLVHHLDPGPLSDSVVRVFSENRLQGVAALDHPELGYQVVQGTEDVCARFSSLSFGPANPANDRVLKLKAGDSQMRSLILIDRQPFFAMLKRERSEIFFLAASDTADLDMNVASEPLADYFSQLLPPAMFLRYAFGDECWRPSPPRATLIIDDPLLCKNYGFMNYERLLALMDQYDFHTSIAFIPHNFRRSTPAIVRMFKKRSDRFSICFHGNDHIAAELAGHDVAVLNATLTSARARMEVHREKTGIVCDNIMAFPMGNFSRSAMEVLKAQNFCAAVNSDYSPRTEHARFTLAELLQPAILKYCDFPLFLRKYLGSIRPEDVVFDVFFGKPVLIVEHHKVFKNPEGLLGAVSMINRLIPDMQWTNLQTVVENAYLARRAPDETLLVQAYSNIGRIKNASDRPLKCLVEWINSEASPVETLLVDGKQVPQSGPESCRVGLSLEIPSGASRQFAVMYRNDFAASNVRQNFRWTMKALVRRRLSELRDNYLTRHPALLSVAKFLLSRITKRNFG